MLLGQFECVEMATLSRSNKLHMRNPKETLQANTYRVEICHWPKCWSGIFFMRVIIWNRFKTVVIPSNEYTYKFRQFSR